VPVGQTETVVVSEAGTPRRHVSFDAALLGGFALIAFALPIAGSYWGWYGSIAAHLAAFVVGILTAVVLGSAASHHLRSVVLPSSR
jgi:membrane associated rhomboid family serine protease